MPMNFVMGDIHNDNIRFERLLKRIDLKDGDHLYLLGDLFDRCETHPDPVGVYFNVLKLRNQVSVVMGNHDLWLADYIDEYYSIPERRRKKLWQHKTFNIIKGRLTDVDILKLAEFIRSFPRQMVIRIDDRKYILAHAMTSLPDDLRNMEYYLMGNDDDSFFKEGIDGYISVCGHTDTSFLSHFGGKYSVSGKPSIWKNTIENVIMMDCGCGFEDGRLACMCLETGEEFYE